MAPSCRRRGATAARALASLVGRAIDRIARVRMESSRARLGRFARAPAAQAVALRCILREQMGRAGARSRGARRYRVLLGLGRDSARLAPSCIAEPLSSEAAHMGKGYIVQGPPSS